MDRGGPETARLGGPLRVSAETLGAPRDARVGRWCADSARWASSGRHVDHRDRRRVMISL